MAPKQEAGVADKPPTYADLGKSARDLFAKGYHYGMAKLELKTTAKNGLEITAGGNYNMDSGKVSGCLEGKHKWADYGITFNEKWNTDNVLSTEVTIEDQIVKGLKLAFDTSFAPMTGKKSGKIKSAFSNEYVNVGCDVDFDFAGPLLHGSAVLRYHGYLAGYQVSFDTAKTKLTKNNFSVGFTKDDFQMLTTVNDGSEFSGSLYQKVSDALETGVALSWNSTTSLTRFAIGAKYAMDKDSSVCAKVNNAGQVGLGYTINLREGVKATISSQLECKQLNAGGHKVGLCIEFQA